MVKKPKLSKSCTCNTWAAQVSKHVCLSTPFVKEATQKGSRKDHCMCIKENKTFHRKAFSATLQASTHLFVTCAGISWPRGSKSSFFIFSMHTNTATQKKHLLIFYISSFLQRVFKLIHLGWPPGDFEYFKLQESTWMEKSKNIFLKTVHNRRNRM